MLFEGAFMSWEETKSWFQALSFPIFMASGGLLIGFLTSGTIERIHSSDWPNVDGEVQSVVVENTFTKDGEKHIGRVRYTYVVDDQVHEGDRIRLSSSPKRGTKKEAQADVSQYRPGIKVVVYYDPADPNQAALEKGLPGWLMALLFGAAAMALVSGTAFVFTIRDWLRAGKDRKASLRDSATAGKSLKTLLTELGEPTAVFKPDAVVKVVGLVFAILLSGGGLTLFGIALYQSLWGTWVWGQIIMLVVGAILVSLVGAAVSWHVKFLQNMGVLVCPEGLVIASHQEPLACRWDEIRKVTEVLTQEHIPLKYGLKHAAPLGPAQVYILERCDGVEIVLNRDIRGLRRLVELVREEASRRGILWETER